MTVQKLHAREDRISENTDMALYISDFFTALATADSVHVNNLAVYDFHLIGNALAVLVLENGEIGRASCRERVL